MSYRGPPNYRPIQRTNMSKEIYDYVRRDLHTKETSIKRDKMTLFYTPGVIMSHICLDGSGVRERIIMSLL